MIYASQILPTPFTDDILDNVGGQEAYSFTHGFTGYHEIK